MPMTKYSFARILTVWLILAGLLMLASCGAEAPTIDPGSIFVTSDPSGAAIFLDGNDTGFTTPYTLTGLDAINYDVSVEAAEFITDPDVVTVDLQLVQSNSAVFTLSATGSKKTGPKSSR